MQINKLFRSFSYIWKYELVEHWNRCSEKLGNFHPWRCLGVAWTRSWAAWSGFGVCMLWAAAWIRNLQRCLHRKSFCESLNLLDLKGTGATSPVSLQKETQSCQVEISPKHLVVLYISHMSCHSPTEVSDFAATQKILEKQMGRKQNITFSQVGSAKIRGHASGGKMTSSKAKVGLLKDTWGGEAYSLLLKCTPSPPVLWKSDVG